MIHCGSRGYGHQVCSDYLRVMEHAVQKYKITLPDRELACAPGNSPEAKDYIEAMACAVNYAFCNRQAIMHWVRQSFQQVYGQDPEKFGLNLVYDVAHNIAKAETHNIDGPERKFGFTVKAQHVLSPRDTQMSQTITAVKGNLCLFQAAWDKFMGAGGFAESDGFNFWLNSAWRRQNDESFSGETSVLGGDIKSSLRETRYRGSRGKRLSIS